ncbi:MAG: hypothetical protein ACXAEX_17770 [Promethearchaeota archaeon]|jgi:hypothetical protein
MRTYRSTKRIFVILISFIIIIQILFVTTPVHAQGQIPTLEIEISCILTEYANDSGQKSNDSSVNIDFPTSTWNLSAININFTSIKMGSETVTIEDQESGFETIRRNYYEICGMQLNISEQITLFAVEIYGYKIVGSSSPGPVYVRIEGWDSGSRRPNGVVYGEQIELNISLIPNWYIQTFTSPIDLSPGYYCLVIDGTSASSSDRYYWYINNLNVNSSLYMCKYDDDEGEWLDRFGDVFLHKIKRRLNRSYYPESINMTAQINNETYQVNNDGTIGKGVFSIVDLNWYPNSTTMSIFIQNNMSIELLLDYEYQISIRNSFIEKAEGVVCENRPVQWILEPQITRISDNHSLKFQFPNKWFNFSVIRNGTNITSQIYLNYSRGLLYLPNATIEDGITWRLVANSPQISFQLNIAKSTFGPNQNIQFSIKEPILEGYYTIILFNSLGYQIDKKTIKLPGDTNYYSYNLSSNPLEGIYKCYTFWTNGTDAGLQIYDFRVDAPFTVPIEIIYGISILIAIIIIFRITSRVVVKRTKKIRKERREKIFNEYRDALNIEYLIVSDKKSGLSVYDQIIAGEKIDPTLISGFLQAIRSFGIELTKSRQESQTIKLEYHESKILMSEFKDFRLVFIMKDNPSEDFLKAVDLLSVDIDENLGAHLVKFDGDLKPFNQIQKIIEKHLQIALIYPLKVVKDEKVKISTIEKQIIERALKVMEQKNTDHFYVSNLFGKNKFQVKDAENILTLIKKKIFTPIAIPPKQ